MRVVETNFTISTTTADRSGWERGVPADTTRETPYEKKQKNSRTRRLVGLPGRFTPITMRQWRDLIELYPTELSIKSISEPGPAKWPSDDEILTSWRHRKAPRCARRGRPKVVQLGQRVLQTVSKCVYKHTEAP